MDGGALWAAVHGVAKSRTQLSDFTPVNKRQVLPLCQVALLFFITSSWGRLVPGKFNLALTEGTPV